MQSKPLTFDYGVHFNTILYPISIIEMTNSLEKIGYELSPSIPFPRPVGRLLGAGEIARKGKTVVHIDSGAQLLLVTDVSIKSALNSFDEIIATFSEDHRIDLGNLVRFYRFTATFEVWTKKKALETIAKNLKAPIQEEFEGILGEEIWPAEIKFAGAGLEANSENWFDIAIRPSYERNDLYVVSIIYRNTDKEKTLGFLRTLEEKVVKIAECIDR